MARREIRITYRILAIIGTVIVLVVIAGYVFLRLNSPYLFSFSEEISETRIKIMQEDLPSLKFYGGLRGCENLLLDKNSMRFWVTDLEGYLTEYNGKERSKLEIRRQIKLGEMLTGITAGPDSTLLVAVSEFNSDGWVHKGGRILSIDTLFTLTETITGTYPSLNGIAMSPGWDLLLFSSSNFNPFNPAGAIYMTGFVDGNWEDPALAIPDFGIANGVYYDRWGDRFIFSNTVEGVYTLHKTDSLPEPVYFKKSFLEITDGLCADPDGNIWMTDPGNGTLKVLLQNKNRIVRFSIKGIGQTSSCRIRMEGSEPVIYFTELKTKQSLRSQEYDGRGVFSVPLKDLMEMMPAGK